MVKLGKRDLKVADARKILVEYNKQYKKEEFGKRSKGGMGVYRMGTAKLEQELKMFKMSKDGKSVKHKTNVKFDYKLPEKDKIPPVVGAKKPAKKPAKKKPKKMKAQTEQDKKDESEGMTGQVKGTTSKSNKNFEKKPAKKKPAKKATAKKATAKKVDTNKVFTAKNGRKYKKKANGQVYFISSK